MLDILLINIPVASPWLWEAFGVGILVLLAMDLSLFAKSYGGDANRTKVGLIESAIWISAALLFNLD